MNISELIDKLQQIRREQDSCLDTNVHDVSVNTNGWRQVVFDIGENDLVHKLEADIVELKEKVADLRSEIEDLENEAQGHRDRKNALSSIVDQLSDLVV